MAFGDSPDDEKLRAGWSVFCDRLRAAGELAFKDYNPADPLQRADAFRFLTQNLGQAFDLALETKDTRFPALHAFCTPTRKLGGDAADFKYLQAWIDGASVYRIHGTLGTHRFFNITVQGPRPATQPGTDIPSLHEPFGDIPEANIFKHQINADTSGAFEIFIGGPQREPNWLPTTPGSRKLFIRQGFDAFDETPSRFVIERIDMAGPRPLPTPDTMIGAMDWAGRFVGELMRDWPDHAYQYSDAVRPDLPNTFPQNDPTDGADQKRGRAVAHMCWALKPDEALIVEFDAHDAFWMVSMNGAFMNSMDYLYRPVSTSPARSKVDPDGKIRLVLADGDTGFYNWLDTQGFALGNLTYRNLMTTVGTDLRTKLVKRAELEAAMPADAARATAQEREAQLWARFRGVQQRYGV